MSNLKLVASEPQSPNSDRDQRIVELFAKGKNGREIGEMLGLSPTRVYEVLNKHRRREKVRQEAERIANLTDAEWLREPIRSLDVPTRAINAIANAVERFSKAEVTIRHVLRFNRAELLARPQFGKNALDELEAALAARGHKIGELSHERDAERETDRLRADVASIRQTLLALQEDRIFNPRNSDAFEWEVKKFRKWSEEMVTFVSDMNKRLHAAEALIIDLMAENARSGETDA